MEKMINNFRNGRWEEIKYLSPRQVREVFDNLKDVDYWLAIEFNNQAAYFQYTGRLMSA